MSANDFSAVLRDFKEALDAAPAAAIVAAKLSLAEGAVYAERRGRSLIVDRMNLDESYVRKHLYYDTGVSRSALNVRIRATYRPVLAPRFGAAVVTKAAKKDSKYLKGDSRRGIAKGQKAAGSNAWGVLRGGNKVAWKNAFFVNLPGSGAWAMVNRIGYDKGLDGSSDWKKNLKVIFSMSVSSAWRGVREEVMPEAMDIVEAGFIKEFGARL